MLQLPKGHEVISCLVIGGTDLAALENLAPAEDRTGDPQAEAEYPARRKAGRQGQASD